MHQRFDVAATVALFGKVYETKQGLSLIKLMSEGLRIRYICQVHTKYSGGV
jgi:hypothetical protein